MTTAEATATPKSKLEAFMEVYARALAKAVLEHPEVYVYPVEDVPAVVEKMRPAIAIMNVNIDGYAFKATCKEIGIKHTRKAIRDYLGIPAPAGR